MINRKFWSQKLVQIWLVIVFVVGFMVSGGSTVQADTWCGEGYTCQDNVYRDYRNWYDCHWSVGVCVDGWDTKTGLCNAGGRPPFIPYYCGFPYYNQVKACDYNTCSYTTTSRFFDCCVGVPDPTPTEGLDPTATPIPTNTPAPTPTTGPTPTPWPYPNCTGATAASCVNVGGSWVITANGVTNNTLLHVVGYDSQGTPAYDDAVSYDDSNGADGWSVTIPQSVHPNGDLWADIYLNNPTYSSVYDPDCNFRVATVPCPIPTSTPTPTTAPTPTPTSAPVTVSGRVYLDPTANASAGLGSQCTDADSTILPSFSYVQINPASGGPTGTVDVNGYWSILTQPLSSAILRLNDKGTYQCQCPSGGPGTSCQYSGANFDTANGGYLTNWNFYVTNILQKWWQVLWSDVHAQSGFTANVPASNYLLVDAPGTSPNSGVATTLNNLSNIVVNGGTLSSRSPTNDKFVDGISSSNWRYSYQSLWQKAGRPTQAGNPGGWNGSGAPTVSGIYYLSGSLNLGTSWNLPAGNYIIFVNGTVFIDHNIKLNNPQNDFLAIIANGNITVGENIGRTTFKTAAQLSADPHGLANLEGAYLTDGNFKVESTGDPGTEKQLVIYGSVAGGMDLSGNVTFDRNLGTNNDKPPVAVIWNPYLLLNAPDELKDAYTDWKEVAP